VLPSTDAVIHGRVLEARARPLDMTASLTLELGDDVTYVDANLNAAVTGLLNLEYGSGDGATAVGSLTVSGEYVAFGNPLALERGQLIFVGPWNNPSLDILAVREVGDVTAGVQVTGTLRTPVSTIFSEPAMSEADALSWMLFGRPVDDVRNSDSNALRGAALSLGLQQALPGMDRFGQTLGLDDFAIRNSESDASEIMAGKYLSPNLYFRYSYGLFNRIGGILLRYRISDRFSLETQSGEQSSMDLFYTVEKE
jgi:translocation and assembly module TamB